MLKKRVLVIFLVCMLLFFLGLLFEGDSKHTSSFTRMVSFTSDKLLGGLIDNELKVIEAPLMEQVTDQDKKSQANQDDQLENDTNISEDTSVVDSNIVEDEIIPQDVVETPQIVYDGLTMDELASKLERSMKNELSGKGYLYASYSIEKGVDPYLALAISLEETGCNWNCSRLVTACNNVGGMIGSGCGGFSAWPTLDDGIRAFIDNIYRNYVLYGLTTADSMNPKYAENPAWASNVNRYINSIKSK